MWSFQCDHSAPQSSCLPWYPDPLFPFTTLPCVSCSLPGGDTLCIKPSLPWWSILASCPHADHHLWLTHMLGLQNVVSCLLVTVDQLNLANQSTSLPSSGLNYDVIKTQSWREPQHWRECPLPWLSPLGNVPQT